MDALRQCVLRQCVIDPRIRPSLTVSYKQRNLGKMIQIRGSLRFLSIVSVWCAALQYHIYVLDLLVGQYQILVLPCFLSCAGTALLT